MIFIVYLIFGIPYLPALSKLDTVVDFDHSRRKFKRYKFEIFNRKRKNFYLITIKFRE